VALGPLLQVPKTFTAKRYKSSSPLLALGYCFSNSDEKVLLFPLQVQAAGPVRIGGVSIEFCVSQAPSSARIASAIEWAWRFIASSLSASIMTRAKGSVPL